MNIRFLPLQSKHQKKSGFTLLEVLVSGAILSAALLALTMLLTYSIKSDDQARNRAVASEIAQEGVDFFLQARNILGWSGLRNNLSHQTYCLRDLNNINMANSDAITNYLTTSSGACSPSTYSITRDGASYQRQASVNLSEDSSINITVTVSWLTGNESFSTSSNLRLRPR